MAPSKKRGKKRTPQIEYRQPKLRQAKLKKPESRLRWLTSYELELGLRPVPCVTGEVQEAHCKFCATFGREEKTAKPSSQFAAVLAKDHRRPIMSKKVFTSFRRDNIVSHLKDQHKTRYAAYEELPKLSQLRATFFERRDVISTFFSGTYTYHFQVPEGVVALIRYLFCNNTTSVASVVLDPEGVLDTEFVAGVEEDTFLEEEGEKYTLIVSDRLQFETVIKCSNAMVSFCAITRLFGIFGEALGNARLGRPSERLVGRYLRTLVAINLVALRTILSGVWAFSLMVEGATHGSEGYLDVRVTFELQARIYNLHLLAIPMGTLSHNAANYAELVLTVLRKIGDGALLRKLIGITSDAAATMLGCRQGFAERIKQACADVGGSTVAVNWCGSHQLNLEMGAFISALNELVGFRTTLGAEISFTRKFDTVRFAVGRCPLYANTRWESISECCEFLTDHDEAITQLHQEKDFAHPSSSWWLILFGIGAVVDQIKIFFRKMQYNTVTMHDQYEALDQLVSSLNLKFEENLQDGGTGISLVKVRHHLRAATIYSPSIFDEKLDEDERLRLAEGFSDAVAAFISGVQSIQTEVDSEVVEAVPAMPKAVVTSNETSFRELVLAHGRELKEYFGTAACSKIWRQYVQFKQKFESDNSFKVAVERSERSEVVDPWRTVDTDKEFSALTSFVLGLASIPPGTHTVEGDFSTLKGVKISHRGSLSNYALEEQLQARQFFYVVPLADEIASAVISQQ